MENSSGFWCNEVLASHGCAKRVVPQSEGARMSSHSVRNSYIEMENRGRYEKGRLHMTKEYGIRCFVCGLLICLAASLVFWKAFDFGQEGSVNAVLIFGTIITFQLLELVLNRIRPKS